MFLKILGLSFFLSLSAYSAAFKLESKAFKNGKELPFEQVYQGFGCSGPNKSPELSWGEPPKGTESFAVTVYDPDAPTGSGWWHWVVYDLPASTRSLPTGAGSEDGSGLPEGAKQGRTDFGTTGYGGACPPAGDKAHRYLFTVFALKTKKLEVPSDATAALIGFNLNQHSLGKATLTAKYARKK